MSPSFHFRRNTVNEPEVAWTNFESDNFDFGINRSSTQELLRKDSKKQSRARGCDSVPNFEFAFTAPETSRTWVIGIFEDFQDIIC
jgi:hypothetical protein